MNRHLLLIFIISLGMFSAFPQSESKIFRERASEFAGQQKFAEAIEEITKAINITPNDQFLYLKRAD